MTKGIGSFLAIITCFMSLDTMAQDFDVDVAIKNLETLVATEQTLPAAKLSLKIGEFYLEENEFEAAIRYFSSSGDFADRLQDPAMQASTAFNLGVAQKLYAESGRLSMEREQQLFKDCIFSFKKADEFYSKAKKKGSRNQLLALYFGGEALFVIGNYQDAVGPLKTVLRYAQKNRNEDLIIKSSDLLARNYNQLDDELNHEYYQSIYESYLDLKVSRDSLGRAQLQLRISKDSLARSRQSLQTSIDSLKRTQHSLRMTSETLNKSKDSLLRSKESLERYEASLKLAEDSLMQSKSSLDQSYMEIALLDSANLEQRSDLEIQQAEIIKQQAEIIKQQEEISKKENEVKNERDRYDKLSGILSENQELLNIMIGATVVVGILLVFAIFAYQYKRRTTKKLKENNRQINAQKSLLEKRQKELKNEKSKTESLLLNILPAPVADELRSNKRVVPRYYKMVTIMFTDFKGFTTIAAEMSPGEIVHELDACFAAFDQIIENYEQKVGRKCVEKIKTIGDGYMCAGGVPIENETNPLDVVRVGMGLIEYMEKRKAEKIARNQPYFELRIGVNTGSVVAGVVGKKKFAYDIWGDAVNLASRMESSGEVGRLNISGDTYVYIKDKYFFTYRGKVEAKNKGEVDMFFVDGRIRYSQANNDRNSTMAGKN